MRSRGEIAAWSSDLGCGVITSPTTPGGCSFHISAFQPTADNASGMPTHTFAELGVGMPVEFTFEDALQDGLAYRAVSIRNARGGPTRV